MMFIGSSRRRQEGWAIEKQVAAASYYDLTLFACKSAQKEGIEGPLVSRSRHKYIVS